MIQESNNSTLWIEKWPAPAKLNLMLRIVGRREDGYHLLQTVFQFVDLCDWITFHPDSAGKISLMNPILGVPEADDLTIKAAKLLKSVANCDLGVCIEVEKILPMGGGLGGGSSDAATVLLVLNKLWDLKFTVEKLMELGLSLGADVPVFVYGYAAWAEGVGEKLEQIRPLEQWVIIIKPNCHVNTKEIFCSKDLTRDSKSITIADFIAGQHQNDCVKVVSQQYSEVKEALVALSAFSEARLTGTGACVFAQFESKELANKAYLSLKKDKWLVYLAKGLNRSLLQSKLNIL
jgi:4-diphosphocytidyl-2-C-methyl-D-erythritol kinase